MYTDKASIRSMICEKRRQLTKEQRDTAQQQCFKHLCVLKEYHNAEYICIYVSMDDELSTRSMIEHSLMMGKKTAAPRIEGKDIVFYTFDSIEDLIPGKWGILEPLKNGDLIPEDALMIMPGVAFDKQKNRLGYGGGYYDRYLEKHKAHKKVALCYDFQILEHLPTESFDIKADCIVTDKRIIC